ncbi:hypothetical protein [Paenibacillus medicaginis]|uniref:Uncharacterized protein n=1 Tax=Paenibacillus medicaginis TaxID=1470560 RepID=A0ABV5BUF4_9BACL
MKTRDYSYLKDTYVEITRSDDEFNEGEQAIVKEVSGDSLYVEVDNGEIFWTDIDSVSYDPDTRQHKVGVDNKFLNEFKALEQHLSDLAEYFSKSELKMSPWQIDGWNASARNLKTKLDKMIKEANVEMWKHYNSKEIQSMPTILKNKETGQYGTLEYSLFGGSVHWYDEKSGALGKSLGDRLDNIFKHWDIVDLPSGYEVGPYGGVRKINKQ